MKYPDNFQIPQNRIPKPWNQGIYGCCVAASIAKVLEVINYIYTGNYTYLSKGYIYGRHSRPDKTQGGMDYAYTIPRLLELGAPPEDMCSIIDELPCIINKISDLPNLDKIDAEARKTRIKSFTKIKGDIYFSDNVKKLLYEKEMPIIGNMVGKRHCTVIVGWEGNKFLYQEHDKKGTIKRGKFNEAYFLEGWEQEMKQFRTFDINSFKTYIEGFNLIRKIKLIQLHHTYSPSYKNFDGTNHQILQNNMRNYHMNNNGWNDIGQNLTIFPDGLIMLGRDLNTAPAGIKGANSNGICIECLGNFDSGGDSMTAAQKNAVVAVTKILLDRYNLNAEDNVTYHAWWSTDGREIGDYVKSASAKTCPGTNFFGGNTLTSYMNNLKPLILSYGKEEKKVEYKPITTINDIVWELCNAGIITDSNLWLKKCEEDINVYWLCRKMANKIRGTDE